MWCPQDRAKGWPHAMYLFEDPVEVPFDPVIILGLILGATVFLLGVRGRRLLFAQPRSSPGYQVLRLDLASVAILWGFAQLAAGAGWLLRLEGLRLPAWSYFSLVIGGAVFGIAWRKLRADWSFEDRARDSRRVTDQAVRVVRSATWNPAALGAGLLAFVTYVLSMSHSYSHPVHWFTSGLAAVTGFAVGLAIWTPRPMVTLVPGKRATGERTSDHRRASGGRNAP